MNEIIPINNSDGVLTVTSRQVAYDFEKRHSDIIVSIEKLLKGCAEKFVDLFIKTEYQEDQNQQWYKEYLITKKGFTLLVMGFNGDKALQWKLKYIDAFDNMEQYIKNQQAPKPVTMLDALSQTLQILQEQDAQIKQLQLTTQNIKDTVISTPDNWREDINRMFNKIVKAVGNKQYQELRSESYKLLEYRAHVDLTRRLNNQRDRMKLEGATKTAINNFNRMDIIESDPKLQEIYSAIVKEYTIKYVA